MSLTFVKMKQLSWLIVVCIHVVYAGEQLPLRDDIPYQINWPGANVDITKFGAADQEYNAEDSFIVTSADKESYRCTVPSKLVLDASESSSTVYHDIAPHKLLAPLFKSGLCVYYYETYWSYEVCHGKHVRQYHEERIRTPGTKDENIVLETEDGQKVIVQKVDTSSGNVKTTEYFLGRMSDKINSEGLLLNPGTVPKTSAEVQTRNVGGVKTSFYPVEMTGGTACDLSGSSRKCSVKYICRPGSRNEVVSVAETSSCEYEVVIHSALLCQNSLYSTHAKRVNEIQCVAIGDSPAKPLALIDLDQMATQRPSASFTSQQKGTPTGDTPTKDELHRVPETTISPLVDKSLLQEFLSGTFCLTGGSGWWRFEFCYGKHVHQYHDDPKQGRTTIVVGQWDEAKHEKWCQEKSSKPRTVKVDKSGAKTVSMVQHFYSDGDVCDQTGKARQVVVRLKCKADASSPHAVTIYMLEPSTCQYILGVESSIVCDLLESSDEFGMLRASSDEAEP